jgi:hypothetical protein
MVKRPNGIKCKGYAERRCQNEMKLHPFTDDNMMKTGIVSFEVTGFLDLSTIRYSEEHGFSETGSLSVLRRGDGRHVLCWVR